MDPDLVDARHVLVRVSSSFGQHQGQTQTSTLNPFGIARLANFPPQCDLVGRIPCFRVFIRISNPKIIVPDDQAWH